MIDMANIFCVALLEVQLHLRVAANQGRRLIVKLHYVQYIGLVTHTDDCVSEIRTY